MADITVTCRFFAQLREICDTDSRDYLLSESTSIHQFQEDLNMEFGHVFSTKIFQIRINGDPITDKSQLLLDGDVIFFFPPVSGG